MNDNMDLPASFLPMWDQFWVMLVTHRAVFLHTFNMFSYSIFRIQMKIQNPMFSFSASRTAKKVLSFRRSGSLYVRHWKHSSILIAASSTTVV